MSGAADRTCTRAEAAVGRREGLEDRDVEPEAGGDLFGGLRFALAIGVVPENEGQLLVAALLAPSQVDLHEVAVGGRYFKEVGIGRNAERINRAATDDGQLELARHRLDGEATGARAGDPGERRIGIGGNPAIGIGSRRRRTFIIVDIENDWPAIRATAGVPAFGVGLKPFDIFLEKGRRRTGHARDDADLEVLRLCECTPHQWDANRW
jgi:hypothetical protein